MRITTKAIGQRRRVPYGTRSLPRGQPIDPDASWSNFCYTAGMERDQAIARLKEHEAELRQLGIEHLYLFGSTARGEAREDSDVDLFFDHPVGSIGLYELMDVKEIASRILGRKADIMTRRSLHRVLRDRIEASALQVF
jgi:predicted nucleotidyltransferase